MYKNFVFARALSESFNSEVDEQEEMEGQFDLQALVKKVEDRLLGHCPADLQAFAGIFEYISASTEPQGTGGQT